MNIKKIDTLIGRIINCPTVLDLPENLQNFIEYVNKQENRNKILWVLYEQLSSTYLSSHYLDSEKYRLSNGPHKACLYFYTQWLWCNSYQYNLKQFTSIIDAINTHLIPPLGDAPSPTRVKEIINHLEKEYELSSFILTEHFIDILWVDSSHRDFKAYLLSTQTKNDFFFQIVLPNYDDKNFSPDFAFLHELGHILHIQSTGSLDTLPPLFIDFVKVLFPSATSHRIRTELFADLFAVVVMINSDMFDSSQYDRITDSDRELFTKYIQTIIWSVPTSSPHLNQPSK